MASPEINMLTDYRSEEKLDAYTDVITDHTLPAVAVKYHNLYANLPDLKDKVILDLPCGLGLEARRFVQEFKAQKVIAVDIVQKQLDLAKKSSNETGIRDDQIEYVCHDAKVPKVLSDLADVCIAAHLLCYAENFEELVGMCQCVYMNLKPGAGLYSISCSLNRESNDVIIEKLNLAGQNILYLDQWSGDAKTPRKFADLMKGFKFEAVCWEYETIVEALEIAGFSKVELRPYQSVPNYSGPYDLDEYLKLVQGNIVIAFK